MPVAGVPLSFRHRSACRPVSTDTSCSGPGPPKMTPTLALASTEFLLGSWRRSELTRSRVMVRQVVLPQHAVPGGQGRPDPVAGGGPGPDKDGLPVLRARQKCPAVGPADHHENGV